MGNGMSKIEASDAVYNYLNSRTVPIISELNLLAPNGGGWLIAELEYEFSKYPNGFFMFYEPAPKNPNYEKGESWTEKFHLSVSYIKLDFDKISIRYDSLKRFEEASNKFNDKFYCSIYDSEKGCAYYLRNNPVVDKAVRSVLGDSTVAEIYDFSTKEKEIRGRQFLQDIEDGKFGETVSCWDIVQALNAPANINEFQESV